jgi:hypothetical protein
LFVKIFFQGKILRFPNVIMGCDATPVIFAYETMEASYQNSIKEIIKSFQVIFTMQS